MNLTISSLQKFLFIIGFSNLIACTGVRNNSELLVKKVPESIQSIAVPGNPSLRGLDVLDDKVVWISGSKGIFGKTADGGKNWLFGKINNDTLLDFRDIHALGADAAIVVSAGSPARIYKTIDGGKSWQLKYENKDSSIFFNSFDFTKKNQGIACSDPINGKFFMIKTNDGGENWDTIDFSILPKPLPLEAGFAASGTSVIITPEGIILFGTGGDKARIIRSNDFGKTWEAVITPLKANKASSGIYSIESMNTNTFLITGGNYKLPDEAIGNTAISYDYGKTWNLTPNFPSGFRSCVAYLPKSETILVCGTNGSDISVDRGNSWQRINLKLINAVDVSDNEKLIVFVGSNGLISWLSK